MKGGGSAVSPAIRFSRKDVVFINSEKHLRAYLVLLLMLAVLLLGVRPADAEAVLPKPARMAYVVDTAGMVMAEDAAQIETLGAELRTKTKAEIVVVTVPTLGGADIETYANALFRSWGIGDAQMNNGVLLLIAKDDRAFRIEVGKGLRAALSDDTAKNILDGMTPDFRAENYSAGILTAYRKLAACTYRTYDVTPSAAAGAAFGEDYAAIAERTADRNIMDVFWDSLWTTPFLIPFGIALIGIMLYGVYISFKELFMIMLGVLTSGRYGVDEDSAGDNNDCGGSSDGGASGSW